MGLKGPKVKKFSESGDKKLDNTFHLVAREAVEKYCSINVGERGC